MAERREPDEGTTNWALAGLPPAESRRLLRHLEPAPLKFEDVLHEADKPIAHVYFPSGGVVSLLAPLEAGKVVEVAIVGKEGVVGLPVFLGGDVAFYRAIVQAPGQAVRLGADVFADLFRRCPTFHQRLLRYAGTFLHQVSQSAACNALHPVAKRYARWLLMAHDRVAEQRLPFTQKFLAMMLAVRLASVSEAASEFRRTGAIRYSRGDVHILDRAALEAACCGCYQAIKDRFDRLASG